MKIKTCLITSLFLSTFTSAQAIDIILVNDEENGATSWAARRDNRTKITKKYDNVRLFCSISQKAYPPIATQDIFLHKGKGTTTKGVMDWQKEFDSLDSLRLIIQLVVDEKGASYPQSIIHQVLATSTYGPKDIITVHFNGIERTSDFQSFLYTIKHNTSEIPTESPPQNTSSGVSTLPVTLGAE